MNTVKKTFVIETSPAVMKRIERFLAMLHWNSHYGHSGLFAMPLDGDGADKVTVDPVPAIGREVGLIGGVGYDVEIAHDTCYAGSFVDKERNNRWRTGQRPVLLKDGEET